MCKDFVYIFLVAVCTVKNLCESVCVCVREYQYVCMFLVVLCLQRYLRVFMCVCVCVHLC